MSPKDILPFLGDACNNASLKNILFFETKNSCYQHLQALKSETGTVATRAKNVSIVKN